MPIRTILRQWNGATSRKADVRPDWFTYKKCYESIKSEAEDLTILLDGTVQNHHFEFASDDKVIEFEGGSDHASLGYALQWVASQDFANDDIIYLVEDDYMHRPGWHAALGEILQYPSVDYVTLYDHADKYMPMYSDLVSRLYQTKSSHWRTTPSTCNTYAGKWSTFKRHFQDHHMKWCMPEHTHDGYDHTKFVELWKAGSNLLSAVPGFSTHCENQFISPVIDWSKL